MLYPIPWMDLDRNHTSIQYFDTVASSLKLISQPM